jgi:uncharacterized protein (UPF0335 family)
MASEFETGTGDNSAARLSGYIDRVKRLSEEKAEKNKEFNADIKDVLDQAKSAGYDAKVIRQIAKLASKDQDALEEEWAVLSMYGKAHKLTIFA